MPEPDMGTLFVPVICDERNPGGLIAKIWNLDTGRPVLTTPMSGTEISELPMHRCSAALVIVYDGDEGTIRLSTTARGGKVNADADQLLAFAGTGDEVQRQIAERVDARAKAITADCKGDPDKPCPLCDDSVHDAKIIAAECHRECALASMIGPYGQVIDEEFWCHNMGDPYAGLGPRGSALKVAELVAEHGAYAVAKRDFPKPETA